MKPEQLEMTKRLQPFFKERMGDWQIGDDIYFGNFPAVIVQIKKEEGLLYARFEDSRNFLSADTFCFANNNFLRIPKPIDWQNPERGLWGMVDWKAYTFDIKHDGTVFLNKRSLTLQIDCISIGDIFTALLKALCEQENL